MIGKDLVGASRHTSEAGALVSALAILLMAAYRLAPHPWNVTPAGALFLLGGLYLGRSWRGWALPLAAVIVSDALLYWRWDHTLWRPERLVDYLAFALVGLVGRAASNCGTAVKAGTVAAAPLVFYLVSNFGVWMGGGHYPRTPTGLLDCYVAGLPFVRGTVVGDWLFGATGILTVEHAVSWRSLKDALAARRQPQSWSAP